MCAHLEKNCKRFLDFEIQTDYHIQSIITILVILKEQHYFLQELPPNLNQELQKTNFDKY